MATVYRPSAATKVRRSRKDPLIEISPDLLTPTPEEPLQSLSIINLSTPEAPATETTAQQVEAGVVPPEEAVTAKRKATSPAAWYAHKKKITSEHPGLNSTEQLILAKKTYEPLGGRIRTAQAIHREAFLLRNPDHGIKSRLELDRAIRADLISRI
jgi:hypothetical protein